MAPYFHLAQTRRGVLFLNDRWAFSLNYRTNVLLTLTLIYNVKGVNMTRVVNRLVCESGGGAGVGTRDE